MTNELRPCSFDLRNGDFFELIKHIPDESIDLIVTDPPYNMDHSTGGCTNRAIRDKWRGNIKAGNTIMDFDIRIKFSAWLPELYRVLKSSSHCYIFCNDKNLQELLNEATKVGFRESNILVWIKNNATPNRYYMKNCEFVLFFRKGKAKPIKNMGSKCAVEIKNINGKEKLHPTQKPVDLIQMFIENSSNEGDFVLDPFMGSGSTGVACVRTNRNFIGIELAEKYFNIAKEQLEQVNQVRGRKEDGN